jgi:hypothetical protein
MNRKASLKVVKILLLAVIRAFLRLNGISTKLSHKSKTVVKVGFVGEFGYALIGLLPYLNYLAKQGVALHTYGLRGSSPFFYFSSQHSEVAGLATGSWGTLTGAWKLRKFGSLFSPLFVPLEVTQRHLSVQSMVWESNRLHVPHADYKHYAPLDLQRGTKKFEELVGSFGRYFVLNVKNYQTWTGVHVPNWYLDNEIGAILEKAKELNLKILVNRSPVPPSEDEPTFTQQAIETLIGSPNVVDLAAYYAALDSHDAGLFQLKILENAEHVWATQGGNAALALICAPSISVIMRGGFDWEDYSFLRKIHPSRSEILPTIFQSGLYDFRNAF